MSGLFGLDEKQITALILATPGMANEVIVRLMMELVRGEGATTFVGTYDGKYRAFLVTKEPE